MASIAVDARRYATDELLKLRRSLPFVTCAIKKLNQHPDLAYILRIPEAAYQDPERFSYKSSLLTDITNGIQSQQADRRRIAESSRESEFQSLPDAHGKQTSGQLIWALRRRDSSDRSSQPHSAPTGIAAQQSENFQRFYRAVVSPTHVRVTAGGRIVPNNRTIAPPLLEWHNDKSNFEPSKQASIPEVNGAPSTTWLSNPQLNSGYTPLNASAFLPAFNLLPQGNSLTMPNVALQIQAIPGAEGSVDQAATPQLAAEAGTNLAQPGLIKISPPTQFDQSRPFVYNGQWLYPVAHPAPVPLPLAMLGNSGFYPQTAMAPAGFIQQQFPVPLASMPSPMIFPAGHHPAMMPSNASQPPEGMPPMSSFMPMPSFVLTSDTLKSRVALLRPQLKLVEDQLSLSEGQVDQGYLDHQRVYLQTQINQMEAMIDNQRAHEINGVKGVNDHGKDNGTTMAHDSSKQISTGIDGAAENDRQPPAVVSSSMATSKIVENNGQANSTQSGEGIKTRSEPTTKSRLTIAAALAPPFQPRSQTVIVQNNPVPPVPQSQSPDIIAMLEANPEMQAEIEARLTAKARGNWSGLSSAANDHYVTFSRGHTVHGEQVKKVIQQPTMPRSNTFHGKTKIVNEDNFVMPPGAVPYLVGTLPHGVNVTVAKPSDFMYSRPLTDEEVRARYLYWGKAPRSVQSGLPKFDGKDFYPPSPVKARVDPVPRDIKTPAPMQDPSFEHLFASPWTPGYKSPSPTGPPRGWGAFGSVPQPVFQISSQDTRTSQLQGASYSTRMINSSNGLTKVDTQPGATYHPHTPPHGATSSAETGDEDFSHLFLEPGVPGYKSPSPQMDKIKKTVIQYSKAKDASPVTPQNREHSDLDEGDDDEIRTQDSWERDGAEAQNFPNAAPQSARSEVPSSVSTVEFNLGQKGRFASPERSFEERVESCKTAEQQSLFLQNLLLKNVAQAPMVGSALSGTVSSATAQGYLPPYRGSAAASFTPAVMNFHNPSLDVDDIDSKHDMAKGFSNAASTLAPGFLSENRPFNTERFLRTAGPPNNAEAYMRYLTLRDETNKQIIEQGWNSNTTGTGPISGPDW